MKKGLAEREGEGEREPTNSRQTKSHRENQGNKIELFKYTQHAVDLTLPPPLRLLFVAIIKCNMLNN